MKICDKRNQDTVPFSSISVGEMFTDQDGDYLMRITTIKHGISDYNVVDLATGSVYSFTDDYHCIKINTAVINITD